MAAIGALPDHVAVAGKDQTAVDVGEKLAVTLFVLLLDGADHLEKLGDAGEALFVSGLGETGVHVGPFVVLAGRGVFEVYRRGGDVALMKQLEPDLGVLFLVARRLFEDLGDLLVAFFFGFAGIVGVLVARLRLAGESGLKILFGLSALDVFHDKNPPSESLYGFPAKISARSPRTFIQYRLF